MQEKLLAHFKLNEMPFKFGPDPRFLNIDPPQYSNAIGSCQYVIQEHLGLAVVFGPVGMGKTTISRRLYEMNRDTSKVAMLINPASKTETAFLSAIMHMFDVKPKRSYADSLRQMEAFIIDSKKRGENLVLIIDEAQMLNKRMFDVIHALHNIESNTDKFLQIILVGQEDLVKKIDALPQIASRVAHFCELSPLTADDTSELIAFRWRTASARGGKSDPFTDVAKDAIFTFSNGRPRETVKLCDTALINAFSEGSDVVDTEHVIDAAKRLRLQESK